MPFIFSRASCFSSYTVTLSRSERPSARAWSARYSGVHTLPGSLERSRAKFAASATVWPSFAPRRSAASARASGASRLTRSSAGGASLPVLYLSKRYAPSTRPSASAWPASSAATRRSAGAASEAFAALARASALAARPPAARSDSRFALFSSPSPIRTSRFAAMPATGSETTSPLLPVKSPAAYRRAHRPPSAASSSASARGGASDLVSGITTASPAAATRSLRDTSISIFPPQIDFARLRLAARCACAILARVALARLRNAARNLSARPREFR